MDQRFLESLKTIARTDMESKHMLTVMCMLDSGLKIKSVDKARWSTQTEAYTSETGRTTREVAMVSSLSPMALTTKASSRTISSKAREHSTQQKLSQRTRALLLREWRMETGS